MKKNIFRFLQHLMMSNNAPLTMGSDFIIVLMCNAYSTHPVSIQLYGNWLSLSLNYFSLQEYFSRPMAALVESINKNVPSTANTNASTYPLPMVTLDSLTVHAKMSLIHRLVDKLNISTDDSKISIFRCAQFAFFKGFIIRFLNSSHTALYHT